MELQFTSKDTLSKESKERGDQVNDNTKSWQHRVGVVTP